MNIWLLCYLPLIFLLILSIRNKNEMLVRLQAKAKKKVGDKTMEEFAKRFIGKDIYVNLVSSKTADGLLKEVFDNAIIIEKNGEESIINLDYVIQLREYPKAKNGKRKSIVID